jgi:hypothetical protein
MQGDCKILPVSREFIRGGALAILPISVNAESAADLLGNEILADALADFCAHPDDERL